MNDIARNDASKSKSWNDGYDAGHAGLVASMMIFPDDIVWADFNHGYEAGSKARNDQD